MKQYKFNPKAEKPAEKRLPEMTSIHRHILVFDSGLGGTTILQALQATLPGCTFSYALDNGAFPYSNKSDEFLLQRTRRLFDHCIPLARPDLVVIACNTASTLILDELRQRFDLPFVGVVPAIKPAAALSKTGVLCLLATEATIRRDYIDQLSLAHASHCELLRLGSQRLVELAEDKMQGKTVSPDAVKAELEPLTQYPQHTGIDVFILGCTHFPALRDELAQAWPRPAVWIDSGEAIARRAHELCRQIDGPDTTAKATLYLTADDGDDRKRQTLERFGINHCHLLEID